MVTQSCSHLSATKTILCLRISGYVSIAEVVQLENLIDITFSLAMSWCTMAGDMLERSDALRFTKIKTFNPVGCVWPSH